MRFQLPADSLKDSIEQSVANGAFLTVFVASEFSVETRVRNVVGFAKDGNGWKLWQYNWQPVDWPLVWPSSLSAAVPADAIRAYRSLSEKERATPLPKPFRGNITGSAPGWKLVCDSVTRGEDDHRCSVDATEADSSTAVELKNVVGGCKLQEGSRSWSTRSSRASAILESNSKAFAISRRTDVTRRPLGKAQDPDAAGIQLERLRVSLPPQ